MRRLAPVLLIALWALGCSTTRIAPNFNGLKSFDGQDVIHLNTTNFAIDLLFVPLIGDASLEGTVSSLTLRARTVGCTNVRIVQSRSTRFWFLFPPFTFIIHPVIGNVAADAVKGL